MLVRAWKLANYFTVSVRVVFFAFTVSMIGPLHAQTHVTDLPSRLPEVGLPIIDCAPAAPAPQDSCMLRVPSAYTLDGLQADAEDSEKVFSILRKDSEMPKGLLSAATLVLVDLSMGENNGRMQTWEREQALIRDLVAGLPQIGELALYGFGADLRLIHGFSNSRSAALSAIDDLTPTEKNTILGTNILEAIALLAKRENALLRNLIIVTDGDEEGLKTYDDINGAAAAAGVNLSALGMYWRPESNARTSLGINVLKNVVADQNGLAASVFLRDAQTASVKQEAFSRQYAEAFNDSGLIMADGDAVAARIIATLNVPIPGQAGRTRSETFEVQFTPVQAEVPIPETEEVIPEENLIFGFPALYVYFGAAVLALLILLLAVFLLLSRKSQVEENDDIDASLGEDQDDAFDFPSASPSHAIPTSPVVAYLLVTDTGERLPIRGTQAVIGRSSDSDIVLSAQGVSRAHAQLNISEQGGISITDKGSLNGTFVNDKPLKGTTTLKIGDEVRFSKLNTRLILP